MKQIATALVKAQKAFGPALKDSVNPAFNRNGKGGKYADLASCINAVMDSLNNNGIALIQQNQPHPDGILVETVFIHESGETLNCGQIFVPATKNDPQGYGSALTYARRYSLMAACGIAPEDDDGNAASKPVNRISPTQGSWESIPPNRQAVLQDVIDAIGERFAADDVHGVYENFIGITDGDEKVALWSKLDSKVRSAIKKQAEISKET
jgi:hypothetical protein